MTLEPAQTIYEWIGGEETVRKLVNAFYKRVQADPLLAPIFPEDIFPVRDKQFMFLTQLFGGPRHYSDQYGSPMLRARHMPFPITRPRAAAWLSCMKQALCDIDVSDEVRDFLVQHLAPIANHMVNQPDETAADGFEIRE